MSQHIVVALLLRLSLLLFRGRGATEWILKHHCLVMINDVVPIWLLRSPTTVAVDVVEATSNELSVEDDSSPC